MDPQIEQLKTTFEMLPDWEERYRFIIDLGRKLEPLADEERTEATRVRGCMSQVWLVADEADDSGALRFRGDSDAHIVRGLIGVLLMIYSDKTPRQIVDTDINALFADLNLEQHITMNRRNGLYSMVETIQRHASQRLDA
ncbi:cysteine desufuration protein SufE [Salinisphaera orenii MK-B5]|uniref:Cysteine desufuration protein SufE n=2 Tax=Salinisphaera orenii TaxID=856731 RepID=A0A423PFX5_9GAMM|nr:MULTISPECIES: SufE family protein [Salinisphaera]ROO24492.1 cysteine desufuration protein SufE [Salinisphaera orenii MK-B5]ROO27896.1 cysteine desufuration protein SufE [Salinisphaera halophila YIM 95161]